MSRSRTLACRGLAPCLVVLFVAHALGACVTMHDSSLRDVHADLIPGALDDVTAPLPKGPLSLDDAARIARARNPELVTLRAQSHVKDVGVLAAGLLPDPQLSLGLTQPVQAPGGETTGVSVSVDWDLGGLAVAGVERAIADDDAKATRTSLQYQESLVIAETRLHAAQLASARARLVVAQGAADAAQALVDVTRNAMTRGEATVDELGVRTVALVDARGRALGIERERDDA